MAIEYLCDLPTKDVEYTFVYVACLCTGRWNQLVCCEYGHRSVGPACFWLVRAPVGGTSMIVVMRAPVGGTSEFMAICCRRHFGGSSHSDIIANI